MATEDRAVPLGEAAAPTIPHSAPAGGTGSLEAAIGEASGIKRFLLILGPGFITGASDDDPSGIGTYAMAGAALGYRTLWMALFTFPLMVAVQFMCAKIGMVTGRGLAGVLRQHHSKTLLYPAVLGLVIANTINAAADLGAIAAAINLITPIRIVYLVLPVTLCILVIQIFCSYRTIANVFKWLTLALLAYIGSSFFAHPHARDVLHGTLVPGFSLNGKSLSIIVAILGTTISPYLFFWQSNQEVEEQIEMGRTTLKQRKGATDNELKYAAWDVITGMFFSNAVMYFIILATAATLFQAGKTDIQSATDAAQALAPIAGNAAKLLLAIGLIGAGLLAVPILTGSSAYAVAESFGWKHGLNRKLSNAREFYALIAGSTIIAMILNFVGIDPMKALFWAAVLNGVLAPPLLIIIMLVSQNRKIMGVRTNGRVLNTLGWATVVLMGAAAVGLAVTWKYS